MGEKEFWTFFATSRFFGSVPEDKSNPLEKYYQEDSDSQERNRQKSVPVSTLIDLQRTEADHFSDYGNHSRNITLNLESENTSSSDAASETLISRLNSHALKSLQNIADYSGECSLEEATVLDDLQRQSRPSSFSLEPVVDRINKLHSDSGASKNICGDGMVAPHLFMNNIETGSRGFKSYSHSEIMEIISETESTEKFSIRKELTIEAEAVHREAVEIISHFWSIYPPGRQEEWGIRLARLVPIINQYLERIEQLSEDDRFLLGPLSLSLKHAVAKYSG